MTKKQLIESAVAKITKKVMKESEDGTIDDRLVQTEVEKCMDKITYVSGVSNEGALVKAILKYLNQKYVKPGKSMGIKY